MQRKFGALLAGLLIPGLGFGLIGQSQARSSAHTNSSAHDPAPPHTGTDSRPVPCKVSISPREDREIIILKLQQRMDCLEVRLDELNREVTVLRAR